VTSWVNAVGSSIDQLKAAAAPGRRTALLCTSWAMRQSPNRLKYGKTLPEFALRWTLPNPLVGTARVRFGTPDEVNEKLGALGWEISDADMAEIDDILARHGAGTLPPGWLED
jgi:aryl-alcohol dehydrogenase-like predicted oxidoreductase